MPIAVDADYPGGNVAVEAVEPGRLLVRPDLRDTTGWWFWWSFRVRGAAGRALRVEFAGEKGPVGPCGPAVKVGRDPWRWADCEFSDRHFVLDVPPGADEVFFAFSFPYQLADFERFLAAHEGHPDLVVSTLGVTRGGRAAPLVAIGDAERAGRHAVLTCRHHACESVASCVLEGAVDWLLSEEAASARARTAFHVAPFMDLDGVEAGDQGKNRAPHDHNRDYTDAPLYPSVRAMQALVKRLAARGLALFVDLHCPWLRGGGNESFFLVEPPEPHAAGLARFREILKREAAGGIPYTGRFDVPFGVEWNVGRENAAAFARGRGGALLRSAFTLECSYSTTEGEPVTPGRARAFGRGLGRALAEFLGASHA